MTTGGGSAAARGTCAWGLFCACSWTWCIGMYLPVIMLGRYGVAGLLVFAIPNVLGCAAFGYVLSKSRSAALVERHRPAMLAFSAITIAYHMLFLPIFAGVLVLPRPEFLGAVSGTWFGIMLAGLVFLAGLTLSFVATTRWPALALLTYALSIWAFVQWGPGSLVHLPLTSAAQTKALVWLAPVICCGFLLCPYLDLTFHRARALAPSPHAFAVFGITFAVMIVFTAAYAGAKVVTAFVVAHVLVQSAFTVGAHLRELRCRAAGIGSGRTLLLIALPLLAVPAYGIVRSVAGSADSIGNDLYLRFLVFYGLVFPAYVLLFMGPGRTLAPDRRNAAGYALIVVGCLPFFEAGFIRGMEWMLAPPAVLAVGWLVSRMRMARGTM